MAASTFRRWRSEVQDTDAVLLLIREHPNSNWQEIARLAAGWRTTWRLLGQAPRAGLALLLARGDARKGLFEKSLDSVKALDSNGYIAYDPATGNCTITLAGAARLQSIGL